MAKNDPNLLMNLNREKDANAGKRNIDVNLMGYINFDGEDDMEEAEAIEEKKRQREIYVKERVQKLILMWNKTKSTDEFEKETDPFVILEVQKTLHRELNDDFKTNIENMQRYLSKKDAN